METPSLMTWGTPYDCSRTTLRPVGEREKRREGEREGERREARVRGGASAAAAVAAPLSALSQTPAFLLAPARLTPGPERDAHSIRQLVDAVLHALAGLVVKDNFLGLGAGGGLREGREREREREREHAAARKKKKGALSLVPPPRPGGGGRARDAQIFQPGASCIAWLPRTGVK
jgi:hypothetical protein